MVIKISEPNDKQKLFLLDHHKYVGYGGARGGGKSWAIRTKALLTGCKYPGIKILIMRQTYPELEQNHIRPLTKLLVPAIADYNQSKKRFTFHNGSTIDFQYCKNDSDLVRIQGAEYDLIFIDEATNFSEYQLKAISACCRGVNTFPKRIYYTCNPGGQSHGYIKRIFIDKRYDDGERAEEYSFTQALVQDNKALMDSDPDYIRQLEALPPKLRQAWLYGSWDMFEGQFFEDFVDSPDHYLDREYTHVIEPFEIPSDWKIYRSYDFGYAKPFSCAWWAVDYDGRIYRILELYGCTGTPNEGLKWNPHEQFKKIHEVETQHPWLKGKRIHGVADPAIWNAESGESVADVAAEHHVYFDKGDNERISGWMQVHYRLAFDDKGIPMMYVFRGCKSFIRTMPLMMYDEHKVEDLDTDLEDHVADEVRYMCMSRPIKPVAKQPDREIGEDPLNQRTRKHRSIYIGHGEA